MISTRIDEVIKPEWVRFLRSEQQTLTLQATTYKAGYEELVRMGKSYKQDREGGKSVEPSKSGTSTPKA